MSIVVRRPGSPDEGEQIPEVVPEPTPAPRETKMVTTYHLDIAYGNSVATGNNHNYVKTCTLYLNFDEDADAFEEARGNFMGIRTDQKFVLLDDYIFNATEIRYARFYTSEKQVYV